MKRFQFSLQKVLDLRQFSEDQAKMALAAAISHAEMIKNQIVEVAEKRAAANASRSNCVDMAEHLAVERFVLRMDVKREELLEELEAAEAVIEEKRAAFAEAMRKRKALSNLREKKLGEYKMEYLRLQEEQTDEINAATNSILLQR